MSDPLLGLLSEDDLLQFRRLQSDIQASGPRYPRFGRLSGFKYQLSAIRDFVCLRKEDAEKRGLVCGLFFFDNGVCVNVAQVARLIGKAKTSVNSSIAKTGYCVLSSKPNEQRCLLELMPSLRTLVAESRRWTIRHFATSDPLACWYGCSCGCKCEPTETVSSCCYAPEGFGGDVECIECSHK